MPPHCDTMDGPVVTAAREALESENVNLILPYVPETGAAEVKAAFEKVVRARKTNPAAREVADLYFFETVVRIHRAGEGAAYTGLKPAGLDEGPVIPVARLPSRPARRRRSSAFSPIPCDRKCGTASIT